MFYWIFCSLLTSGLGQALVSYILPIWIHSLTAVFPFIFFSTSGAIFFMPAASKFPVFIVFLFEESILLWLRVFFQTKHHERYALFKLIFLQTFDIQFCYLPSLPVCYHPYTCFSSYLITPPIVIKTFFLNAIYTPSEFLFVFLNSSINCLHFSEFCKPICVYTLLFPSPRSCHSAASPVSYLI